MQEKMVEDLLEKHKFRANHCNFESEYERIPHTFKTMLMPRKEVPRINSHHVSLEL